MTRKMWGTEQKLLAFFTEGSDTSTPFRKRLLDYTTVKGGCLVYRAYPKFHMGTTKYHAELSQYGLPPIDTIVLSRLLYFLCIEHLPKGVDLHPTCCNDPCLNPWHKKFVSKRAKSSQGFVSYRKISILWRHEEEFLSIYDEEVEDLNSVKIWIQKSTERIGESCIKVNVSMYNNRDYTELSNCGKIAVNRLLYRLTNLKSLGVGVLQPYCDTPECANPWHQRVVSRSECIRAGGSSVSALRKRKKIEMEAETFWELDKLGLIEWKMQLEHGSYEGNLVKVIPSPKKLKRMYL